MLKIHIYIYQTKVGGISLFQVLIETQNVDSLKLKTFYFQTWSLLRIDKVFYTNISKGQIELQRFVVDMKEEKKQFLGVCIFCV